MRVFKTKLIRLQLTAEELDALTADFISYKRDGVLPDIFGRDALYDDSFTWPLIKFERVAHIHLANVNNPFPPQLRQFSRTNDEAHLVYCQGAFDEQAGNDSNLLIVFYVQIMPDDFVMQLHRF